jgi:hypothetical protein
LKSSSCWEGFDNSRDDGIKITKNQRTDKEMKNYKLVLMALSLGGLFFANNAGAVNPVIMDQYTADPTARVFEGKVYLYPSHDIPASPGRGRGGWFVMEDYHVFSSENLMDWTDHGVILNQTNVPWLNGRMPFNMWAPDCVFKNGKYYFYFPVGGQIGIAIADKPYGPFKPEPQPIRGAGGIDPQVLLDTDGSAYLFWKGSPISVAKLKTNMVELDGPGRGIANLPTSGTIEGPFPFERNGIYYLVYPHQIATERLEYATSTNPMGPYKVAGVILDEAKSGCWTVQASVVQYKGDWILFYHDKELSPDFDKNRAVRADYMYFNEDGTIKKVIPTLRGVGIADAKSKLQIARYSDISKEGVSISFLNDSNKFEGWKISLNGTNTWVQFNKVDFGKGDLKSLNVRSISSTGGAVEIHLDKTDGPLVTKVEIGKGTDWKVVNSKLVNVPAGIHDLVVTQSEDNKVDLNWISFE